MANDVALDERGKSFHLEAMYMPLCIVLTNTAKSVKLGLIASNDHYEQPLRHITSGKCSLLSINDTMGIARSCSPSHACFKRMYGEHPLAEVLAQA